MEFWVTFTNVFGMFRELDGRGKPKQHDAEEFWTLLLQCLRKLPPLKNGLSANNLVEQLFSGEMVEELKCEDTEEEPPTFKSSTFEKLPCHISNEISTLYQGLDKSLTEMIEKKTLLF